MIAFLSALLIDEHLSTGDTIGRLIGSVPGLVVVGANPLLNRGKRHLRSYVTLISVAFSDL